MMRVARRLVGFNLLSAIVLGAGGFILGHWAGESIKSGSFDYVTTAGESDMGLVLGYVLGVAGFFAGLGAFNYPIRRMLGYPPSLPAEEDADGSGIGRYLRFTPNHKVVGMQYLVGVGRGIGRYLRFTPNHKVVGMQYLAGVGLFFLFAGINSMLIRVELFQPNQSIFPPDKYLMVVGLHGSMMMGTMTSAVLGPFANYVVPLLIGARRSAFPRIEALSFWVLVAGETILATSVLLGTFQTGWTGYPPLSEQGTYAVDAYLCFFALIGVSMALLGFNLTATIVTQRAPGMTWGRLPIFAWSVITTAVMMVLAAPVLTVACVLSLLDRTAQTSYFVNAFGGSSYLWENLFWFFGHPEVYLLALPGMGIVLELLPVFSRKPLWGYRVAVAGMIGIAVLSFTVWQHHLFVSGISADLRLFYVLSTELISIPTGLVFVAALGTIWQGRVRLTVPMLFALAWIFNFFIGGITGIYLSDAPTNTTDHGSFFVLAHFHYTIMGGLIFAFFAGLYYWMPKMTGRMLNQALGKVHFWLMFLAFNSTFLPLFAAGMLGQPRRAIGYPTNLTFLNEWASVSAFVLGVSMLVFLANLAYSLVIAPQPAPANPWASNSLEWQTASPPPAHNFDVIPEIGVPHVYGVDPEPAVVKT